MGGPYLILAKSQGGALQLLNDGIIKVAVLLPELQELMQRGRLVRRAEAMPLSPSRSPAATHPPTQPQQPHTRAIFCCLSSSTARKLVQ